MWASLSAMLVPALEKAIIAVWPKIEPLIQQAAVNALRTGLTAIKNQTVPDSSPFKALEGIADNVIDAILEKLPAPAAQ